MDYPVLYLLEAASNHEYSAAGADFLTPTGLAPDCMIVPLQTSRPRGRDYLAKNAASACDSGRADLFPHNLAQVLAAVTEEPAAVVRLYEASTRSDLQSVYGNMEALEQKLLGGGK